MLREVRNLLAVREFIIRDKQREGRLKIRMELYMKEMTEDGIAIPHYINYETFQPVSTAYSLSVMGDWEKLYGTRYVTVASGQVIDILAFLIRTDRIDDVYEIVDGKKVKKNKEIAKTILKIWEKYHLNDMKAGTKKQEEIIDQYFDETNYDYEEACKVLEEHGLLVDKGYKYDEGYRYGTKWLYMPLPEEVLVFMENREDVKL